MSEKKQFKVHITEMFSRDVIVLAEDEYRAEEIAEELCSGGVIDITNDDNFDGRNIESVGAPDESDIKELRRYECI